MFRTFTKPLSRRDAGIIAAAIAGTRPLEVAGQFSCTLHAVECVLSRARASGFFVPKQKSGPKGPHGWRETAAAG